MRRFRSAALAGATILALAGCADVSTTAPASSPSTSEATSATPVFPVTIGEGKDAVTIEQQPKAIVSLSPTATENLFAIGAGDQVVAADEYSDYPAEAPTTKLSGFDTSVESIVAYEPDLVVIQFDPGDLVAGLQDLGVPTLVQPAAADMDAAYAQIEDLGLATGHVDEAAAVVERMRADVDAALAAAPDATGMSVYHELDDTYYSVTSSTFIGQIYEAFGLTNIADEAKGAASGYPQLSAEHIVESDPDLIVLADGDCCGQSAETVAARQGWAGLSAVKRGNVIVVDEAESSRWGPRIVSFIEDVSAAVQEAAA